MIYLVINNIQSKNADCVDAFLSATRSPSPVITTCWKRKGIHYTVLRINICLVFITLTHQFLGRQCTLGSLHLASSAPQGVINNIARPANTFVSDRLSFECQYMVYLEPISEESVVKKSVSYDELNHNNDKIEELTENETTKVDIVSEKKKISCTVNYLDNKMSDQSTYLLWILRQKNWTNFSLFSSWSSMNLKQWQCNEYAQHKQIICMVL